MSEAGKGGKADGRKAAGGKARDEKASGKNAQSEKAKSGTTRSDEAQAFDPKPLLRRIPHKPGVYQFMDADGTVLYVGKAKDLRSRVSSYFQPSSDLLNTRGPEIARMAARVEDIDFLECETEVDAILKEARLIKDIQPPHNAQLNDSLAQDFATPLPEIATSTLSSRVPNRSARLPCK